MKKLLILLVIVLVVTLGLVIFFKYFPSDVGIWEECNPSSNNCASDLECKRYGKTDIFRCVKYLKEGDECGLSEAKICDSDLICVDTDKKRVRCGAISVEGEQECFEESLQICKRP